MSRKKSNTHLDTRNARLRLKQRREPYWGLISGRLYIGYRRGAKGGTWIARHHTPEHGRQYKSLGMADDIVEADNAHVLDYDQARKAADEWFGELALEDGGKLKTGSYTVRNAMDDYVRDFKRRGGKGLYVLETIIKAHINPAFGDMPVMRLKRIKIENWLDGIASKPPRARTKKGQEQAYHEIPKGDEAQRRRKSTANRILTVLKAALNLAHQHGRTASPKAWRTVKPNKGVDAPKIRYLDDEETKRLVNACPKDLRAIVTAALLSGARYGELGALTAGDYTAVSGTLHIARSKSGKTRDIVLTDEGKKFFEQAVLGKSRGDLLFRRSTGSAWKHAEQFRPMKEACKKANIAPAISFHILRHSYASRLAMRAVPMGVIAAQLGHSGTRQTEKHYAHLAESFVASSIRAAFTSLGIVEDTNVKPMQKKAKS